MFASSVECPRSSHTHVILTLLDIAQIEQLVHQCISPKISNYAWDVLGRYAQEDGLRFSKLTKLGWYMLYVTESNSEGGTHRSSSTSLL